MDLNKIKFSSGTYKNPVHEEDGQWYFWDETWMYRYGPFKTEIEAKTECRNYGNYLHQQAIKETLTKMKINKLEQTCGACPTIFEWFDDKDERYYFRLRHGYAKIVRDKDSHIIVEAKMPGFDGICNFDDAEEWAKNQGVIFEL